MPPTPKVELYYFPRQPNPKARSTELLEVVFFRTKPKAALRESREGETVALFVYAGDAVAYATHRQAAVQMFLDSDGEVAALFAHAGEAVDYAAPAEGGAVHTSFKPAEAFAGPLWGIVIRPSRVRLPRRGRFDALEL